MKRTGCLLVAGFVVLGTAVGLFVAGELQQMHEVEQQGWDMAGIAGSLQAESDFAKGELQIYELSVENRFEPTGRSDGPFTIVYMPVAFGKGPPAPKLRTFFIQAYNDEMRTLVAVAARHQSAKNSATEPAANR